MDEKRQEALLRWPSWRGDGFPTPPATAEIAGIPAMPERHVRSFRFNPEEIEALQGVVDQGLATWDKYEERFNLTVPGGKNLWYKARGLEPYTDEYSVYENLALFEESVQIPSNLFLQLLKRMRDN